MVENAKKKRKKKLAWINATIRNNCEKEVDNFVIRWRGKKK